MKWPGAIRATPPSYAIDALDQHERAGFDRHLARCKHCRDELEEISHAAIAPGFEPAEPHATLRARLLAAARCETQDTPQPSRIARALRSVWPASLSATLEAVMIAAGIV